MEALVIDDCPARMDRAPLTQPHLQSSRSPAVTAGDEQVSVQSPWRIDQTLGQ